VDKPEILLVGAGGHTHACIDVVELQGAYSIAGLIGQQHEIGERHFGYEVIGCDDDLPQLVHDYSNALITVGQIKSPERRIHLYHLLKGIGFSLPVIISPRAYVSRHATIGDGTVVMHDALVNAGARIGDNCIINTKALIEHDAQVGPHCHVSTGCIVNGGAVVSDMCFLGSGSSIINGVIIGERGLIGMGKVVRQSQGENIRLV